MQFEEMPSVQGKCPVCGTPVPKLSTRGLQNYCSRVCKSQRKFSHRYQGTLAGPKDKPTLLEKTKLP